MAISGPHGIFLLTTFKIAILIHGVIILGVGFHSRNHSSWVTETLQLVPLDIDQGHGEAHTSPPVTLKGYQICQFPNLIQPPEDTPICPDASMEEMFILTLCLTYGVSLFGWLLLWSRMVDTKMICWQLVEISYHVACSMLLFIAAVMYIESAYEIAKFTKGKDFSDAFRKELKTQEKVAAGAFALMQSLLYGLVAGLLGHRMTTIKLDIFL